MNTAPHLFGQRLRLARERLGIPLEAIAESTKIARPLLADLERGDVSKWPRGIYRRAFVREYAAAIGLPADEVVAEFVELFPEDGTSATPRADKSVRSAALRLTFEPDPAQAAIGVARRLAVAFLELVAILALGWLLTRFVEASVWTVCGVIALTYYPLAAALTTRAPAFRWPSAANDEAASGLRELVPVQSGDDRVA